MNRSDSGKGDEMRFASAWHSQRSLSAISIPQHSCPAGAHVQHLTGTLEMAGHFAILRSARPTPPERFGGVP